MELNRSDFGEDFIFGAGTSNYQIGRSYRCRRKRPWKLGLLDSKIPIANNNFEEIFQFADIVSDGSNAKIACNSYDLHKEDVKMLKKMGVDAYRFSISWPRILPGGKLDAGKNKEGIKYYNNLIDELMANGIKPVVTLFHWDLPQVLDDEYKSFLSRQIVDDFRDYAELCFWEFGDRVKHWVTFNEPYSYIFIGYLVPAFLSGYGSYSPLSVNQGMQHRDLVNVPIRPATVNPDRDPYVAAHHLLLAHAEVVKSYRQNFKYQRGKIGITLNCEWYLPLSDSKADREAVGRALDFLFGWFMEPLVRGKYPQTMVHRVGHRLPRFSHEESAKLIGSFDFLGLNYYTGQFIKNGYAKPTPTFPPSYLDDEDVTTQDMFNLHHPEGLFKLLPYIKLNYKNPLIYITENGADQAKSEYIKYSTARRDPERIHYVQGHLEYIKKAMENDVNVQAYFVWSLIDDFEWQSGYTKRYGLAYVDFKDLARYPKDSAIWFRNFLDKGEEAVEDPKLKSITSFASKRAFDAIGEESPAKKLARS